MKKTKYNIVRKNQADLHGLLRALVSLYLLYLAYHLLFAGRDDSSFPPAARIAAGILFAVCAVAFGIYAFRRYQADRRKAELTDEEKEALERNGDDV